MKIFDKKTINKNSIQLGDREFIIKNNNYTRFLYEVVAGKKISEITDSFADTLYLFYACLQANNEDFDIDLKQFIELTDLNENCISDFLNIYISQNKAIETGSDEKKKKVKA